MKEHFQVVFLVKMAVSIIPVRTSTVSLLILKCLLNFRVSALTQLSIYSRYGLFLEIAHELPNFYDIVKEEYMKPGHKFILHVRDMLNQNLH